MICRVDRVCTEDTELGEIKVPKGVVVTFPLYPLNHDPETWPNPEKFDPDRYNLCPIFGKTFRVFPYRVRLGQTGKCQDICVKSPPVVTKLHNVL